MLACPFLNIGRRARGATVRIGSAPVAFLKEPLVLALQLVVEYHSGDAGAALSQAHGGALECLVDPCVVSEFAWPQTIGMERLCSSCSSVALVSFKQGPTAPGQRHQRRLVGPIQRSDNANEPLFPK